MIVIREFNQERDCLQVEQVERNCEVGSCGKMSLLTHMLGDPISRIRNSPTFLMLVAEMEVGAEKKIVGLIRGCIKTVTCGKKYSRIGKNGHDSNDSHHICPVPIYTKLAYILGLRVSPSHRRKGVGLKLVTQIESWFRENGAEYSYMATESENEASVTLFTKKCGYAKFRTPSILVQPVFAHRVKISKKVSIFQLTPSQAEKFYRKNYSTTEFFPRDIDSVLNNKLNLGTYAAVSSSKSWTDADQFLFDPSESWAILSIWNNKEVFKLEVCGAPLFKRALAKTSRVMDGLFPWMGIPSVPNMFRPFGSHFLYGVGGNGPQAVKFTKALCGFAHNLARKHGCSMVATEVAGQEPLRDGIPHWKRLSCEDLWCMKRLGEEYSDGSVGDWTKCPPGSSIFVDPREL
ncbi:hypothetical protein ACHQM5_015699 [Ranunculus cassubicifolius]